MRVLIVGPTNHQFIINLVKSINKESPDIIFDLFCLYNVNKDFESNYFRNIYTPNYYGIDKIPLVRRFIRGYFIKKTAKKIKEKYDICNIHSFEPHVHYLEELINHNCDKLVISMWGSDVYRRSKEQLMEQKNLLDKATRITFTYHTLKDLFETNWSKQKEKTEILNFGSAIIEQLTEKLNSEDKRIKSKKYLGLHPEKITVSIGYSCAAYHRHQQIIEALDKLEASVLNRFEFILPMTYPFSENYYLTIKKILEKTKLNYKIFITPFSDDDITQLRFATDVLIINLIYDQLSATVMENLYIGNKVIAGEWLPYQVLKENEGNIELFKQIEELPRILSRINNAEYPINEKIQNFISNLLLSWNKVAPNWVKLYKNLQE